MHQEYLPPMLVDEKILLEEGDVTGKVWDEGALRQWEWRRNGGNDWQGRTQRSDSKTKAD